MSARPAPDELGAFTLARQFPAIGGRDVGAVVELLDRLGPIQTQVPRAVFLTAASRLPGITHAAVVDAFEQHALVKGTTLRGTVHTSSPRRHAWSAAVAGVRLDPALRGALGLERLDPTEVRAETERIASGGWIERDSLVERVADWLAIQEVAGAGAVPDSHARNAIWGAPRLVRRPADARWHTRTDTLHRSASDVYTVDAADHDPDVARAALARAHLAAYGPATRRDIAWWLGDTLTAVDRAVAALGDEVDVLADGKDPLLDLADAPPQGTDPGVRLLPEFDGLLLGYAPANRDRFIDVDHLPRIFNRVNGTASPVVLSGGRIVGVWRPTQRSGVLEVDVDALPGETVPHVSALEEAANDAARVLGPGSAEVIVSVADG